MESINRVFGGTFFLAVFDIYRVLNSKNYKIIWQMTDPRGEEPKHSLLPLNENEEHNNAFDVTTV